MPTVRRVEPFVPWKYETLTNQGERVRPPGATVTAVLLPRFCMTGHEDGISHGLAIGLTDTLMLHVWRTLDDDGHDLWHVTLFDKARNFSQPITIESGDALFVTTPDGKSYGFPVGADSLYDPS